jgi:hypothetical protein
MKKTVIEEPLFFTPVQIASRWHWHAESVRRKIRRGEIASVVISRRRLVPFEEILRIEAEGTITATSSSDFNGYHNQPTKTNDKTK